MFCWGGGGGGSSSVEMYKGRKEAKRRGWKKERVGCYGKEKKGGGSGRRRKEMEGWRQEGGWQE